MALWAKIQTLSTECQRQILSLYNEEHQKYKFPIEVRNIFAEVIEKAVCGGNICSVEAGLDPYNSHHRELIVDFFSSLIGQLEERLQNAQSGDQFFTRHKLSEALANYKDKQQSDPLGMYEYMRNRIKTEVGLVVEQEAADSSNSSLERDAILVNINDIKLHVAEGANILKEIRSNEENFALHCNKKQELEGYLANPEHMQLGLQQSPDYEIRIKQNLEVLANLLQQNIRHFQNLMGRFEQTIVDNLSRVSILQNQIILEKLAVWKHEQQQMANGIHKVPSENLDVLQRWCEELADVIWKLYENLKDAERILQNGIVPTGNNADLTFVQGRSEEVLRLLHELLNHSLIVEEQPPQIIKMKTKFQKPVIVSLLVGRRLNIHMNSPELSTCIINEEQARKLNEHKGKLDTIGEITNGKTMMDKSRDDFKRITFPFRSMQLKTVKRTDRRGSVSSERVMEEKSCLHFECTVTVGPVGFKIFTISLPVVVISHGSQEALAVASISWDNAFGERGRVPFVVPPEALWEDVAQILNAKFREVTRRGLTPDNLACLAKKAFKNNPPRDKITWGELCKDQLPGRNFTFWAWFHAALKLIEKKETNLKELWKEGLITGFIERETAETLIKQCKIGTFLLRFSDSITGAITIALLVKPGQVVSLNPFQMLDLQSKKISMSIKELEKLKFLYQPNRSIPKDEAFKKFYESENGQTPSAVNGYVPIRPSIPDDDDSASGSATPIPTYNGSRYSEGSLPGLSPIPYEQAQSPFHAYPASPSNSTFYDAQSPSSTTTIGMDTSGYENTNRPNSFNGLLYIANASTNPLSPISNNGELDTPLPVTDAPIFQFANNNEFEFTDLIRVIQRDPDVQMEEHL